MLYKQYSNEDIEAPATTMTVTLELEPIGNDEFGPDIQMNFTHLKEVFACLKENVEKGNEMLLPDTLTRVENMNPDQEDIEWKNLEDHIGNYKDMLEFLNKIIDTPYGKSHKSFTEYLYSSVYIETLDHFLPIFDKIEVPDKALEYQIKRMVTTLTSMKEYNIKAGYVHVFIDFC